MEIKQVSKEIESKFSLQNGYLFKRASLSMELTVGADSYPVKITHESKAFSDFYFHKKEELIQKAFVFYLCTKSGIWYNFSTIENLFQFLGLVYDKNLINESVFDEVKTCSSFTANELQQ